MTHDLTLSGFDDDADAHLVAAIGLYLKLSRRNGLEVPRRLQEAAREIAEQGSERVAEGQRGPSFDGASGTPNSPSHEGKTVLTTDEAAKYLRVSVSTLKRRRRTGELAALQSGGIVRFRRQDLDDFIDRSMKC